MQAFLSCAFVIILPLVSLTDASVGWGWGYSGGIAEVPSYGIGVYGKGQGGYIGGGFSGLGGGWGWKGRSEFGGGGGGVYYGGKGGGHGSYGGGEFDGREVGGIVGVGGYGRRR